MMTFQELLCKARSRRFWLLRPQLQQQPSLKQRQTQAEACLPTQEMAGHHKLDTFSAIPGWPIVRVLAMNKLSKLTSKSLLPAPPFRASVQYQAEPRCQWPMSRPLVP